MGVVLLLLLVALLALPYGLAQAWSRTPHGRLRPIFAFAFRLQSLLGVEGVLSQPMRTEAERTRARAAFLRDTSFLSQRRSFAGEVVDRVLEGPGGALRVRIYTPVGEGPFPLLLYFHGGGFVVGAPEYTETVTRGVAAEAPAVVVSVDYRLAPESPWPAAVEDAGFALGWCVKHAREIRVDPDRIGVGGDSAGGNLAAVLTLRDRDRSVRCIRLQVLIYPVLDGVRRDRDCQRAFARGYGLSMRDVASCFDHYLPAVAERRHPEVSPLYAATFADLPRALVFTAGFDVLRDEGIEYVAKLEKAGVAVEHVHRPEMPHGYITATRFCRDARDDIAQIATIVGQL